MGEWMEKLSQKAFTVKMALLALQSSEKKNGCLMTLDLA